MTVTLVNKNDKDLVEKPQHIVVVMDGNGRWAAKHGKARI